jgi:hypothetical protein
MAVDAATPAVVDALRGNGIRALLLKGPALERLLDEDRTRSHSDMDLLVAPADVVRAESVLVELGFEGPFEQGPEHRQWHAHTWVHERERVPVDLHRTLVGIGAEPKAVWEAYCANTETVTMRGVDIEIPSAAARTLQVALHAAHHGVQIGKPLADLDRALERVDEATWREAAQLAETLRATVPFATGLRLLPAGQALAHRLGLPETRSVEAALRAETVPPMALGFVWLSEAHGARAKARLVARELFPSPAFLRTWTPLARRGPAGLAAAYVWRTLWLFLHFPGAFRAWRRARSAGRG